jgi:cytoskeletal protein CcmA (bactofilin family)
VGTAVIKGTVNGHIQAAERIEIHPPAKITGDIQAPVVSIETGVVFNGNCSMVKPEPILADKRPSVDKPADKKPA